ncbi:plant-specific TFIIB-related protein PTF2-like [Nicotiana tabacum]|uniref:Plant-specific TFIIB-related protein PTF2-like n=5 Tax=Nicotiana tabacum TaxID=4097 RepID=A0AC58U5Y7_TOBAC
MSESSRPCKNCHKRTIAKDEETWNLVCKSCGIVQDFDNYDPQIGGITGAVGTYVRHGSAGSGSVYNYKESKDYHAKILIDDLMSQLGLSNKSSDVRGMLYEITEGEFGQGRWFEVCIGACAYVLMRKDSKPISIVKVAEIVKCDIYELGRMVYRVVDFLDIKLPEFDIINSFEHYIKEAPIFSGVEEDIKGRMLKQGVFLVQCLVKWYVTTGRRPLPVVAAVLVFAAQLNQVDLTIEDVAEELQVAVVTCKLRYKELLERLVKVARGLPWGEDVTVKNIMKHAPFVIQYMELKSMSKNSDKRKSFKDVGVDLDYLIDDFLSNGNVVDIKSDSQYFQMDPSLSIESPNRFQISQECLAMIYTKIKNQVSVLESANSRYSKERETKSTYDWWQGESEMSKKLLVKQILEKDVGLSTTPPSFDRGCSANERRKAKIKAAKCRIHKTMYPSDAGSIDKIEQCPVEHVNGGKKRRRKMKVDVDWEDFIIETLLLHQVEEEEIEKGYYKALLDLHVFNY